VQTALFR
jgi:ubiquinone/menaquinone biosynthesis C-methylase UbiE